MKIHLIKALFINRAPFERLELDFNENEISVLTAVNGRGKTTVLSHIVDAFYEMARPHFPNEFEEKQHKFYRVSSAIHNLIRHQPSFVYLRFQSGEGIIDYLDIRNNCTEQEYNDNMSIDGKIAFSEISSFLEQNNYIKKVSTSFDKKKADQIFSNNILTYFPSYRFEMPGYLNDPYKINIDFKKESGFSGYLLNPIEVISGLPQLANWIMDVVLDLRINGNDQDHLFFNLNAIISNTLLSKNYGSLRFGVGPRGLGGTRIQILQNIENGQMIYPSIFNLSSGESSLLCLFGEFIRQADNVKNNIQLNEITGIILIDEVDKHLHIRLQKEVLPLLFNLFPNVQFILSSHSPFLSMGLAEIAKDRTKIIDIDNFGISKDPSSNEIYTEVYNMMIGENDRFRAMYLGLQEKINEGTKPLIITEGKTDIKHIKIAKEKLNLSDLDIEFIDPGCQPDGSSNLKNLLEKLSKIKHQRKIVGIFDRDEKGIIKDIEKDGQIYNNYGNGVFAFCITTPAIRQEQGQDEISIEYLYSDDEIKTRIGNNCRLFFGTEFSRNSMRHNSEDLTLNKPDGKGKDKIIENNGGQAVYDNTDANVLAKKDDFANAILNDEIIICNDSWENFRSIFNKIRAIINTEQ